MGNYLVASGNVALMLSDELSKLPQTSFSMGKSMVQFGNVYSALKLFDGRTRKILFRPTDRSYFLASTEGLLHIDSTGYAQEIFNQNNRSIIPRGILLDDDNRLWVASQQGDLGYVNTENNYFPLKQPFDGFTDRLYTKEQKLWLITGQKVRLLDLASLKWIELPMLNALQNQRFYDVLSTDQHLYVASSKGLMRISKASEQPFQEPLLLLSSLEVDGKAWDLDKTIPYRTQQIGLSFDVIHHGSMGNRSLWYRFKNQKSEWIQIPNGQQRIQFEVASSGTYHIEVRALAAGLYSPSIPVHFKVSYPFWLQPLGLALILGACFLLALGMVQLYVRRIRQQQAQREAMLNARLTALRSQMNPHFLFNVLNAVQGYIYGNQKTKASEYLKHFSTLIRGFLAHSDRNSIPLDEEMELLNTYITLECARMDEVQVHWEVDDALEPSEWKLPPGIIQPFVENAFKHGLLHQDGERHLWLRFWIDDKSLRIQIEDNGIGRQAAEAQKATGKHRSFATQATTERIRLLQELGEFSPSCNITDLYDNHQHPKGTLVDLTIT